MGFKNKFFLHRENYETLNIFLICKQFLFFHLPDSDVLLEIFSTSFLMAVLSELPSKVLLMGLDETEGPL